MSFNEVEYHVSGRRGSKFLCLANSSKKFLAFLPSSTVQNLKGFRTSLLPSFPTSFASRSVWYSEQYKRGEVEYTPTRMFSFTKSRNTSFHSKSSRMRVSFGSTGTSVFEKWSYSMVTTSPFAGSSSPDIWWVESCSLVPFGLNWVFEFYIILYYIFFFLNKNYGFDNGD